jgi:DNA polymerase (family 10)
VGSFDNGAVADRLDAFASLLELAGSTFYAARAYRRAAETIRETLAPVEELIRSGRIRELRGIGPGIAAKLSELVETGTIAELDELEREVQPELVGLGRYLGIGPKRILEIARELDVETAAQFRELATAGGLRKARGIGPVTEQRLLDRLNQQPVSRPPRGLLLNQARTLVERIAAQLGGEIAGDVRRWTETPQDLAVVVAAPNPRKTLDKFERLADIVAVVERAERSAIGVTVEGVAVTLTAAEPARFGTELVRATGTADYVAGLGPLPDRPQELDVYRALGVPWCPPELREGPFRGEPPRLVELSDVRGDLHCHSTWSDGKATVREMALAAIELGYEYIAICDHTPNVRIVPGLDADALRRQGEEIAAVNEGVAPFRVLRGTEVDIRRDGKLDLPDDVLDELDWVQLSLHAGQRETRDTLTRKVTNAMRHPAVSCLSHPTGRLINHRPPNALDIERVIEVALETGVALEINGLPNRLDLSAAHARLAVEAGVPLVASTDAHSTRGLGNMELAIATARRGWATTGNLVNTREWSAIPRRQPRSDKSGSASSS